MHLMLFLDVMLHLFVERNPLAGVSLLAAVVCGAMAVFSQVAVWSWVLGGAAGLFAIVTLALLIRGD